ncbi:NADPH:quinone reductase [Streptomyces longisporoflavus]|uniref:NADP-dependent oxidoreductase n=1 Tax=Streptomyces longisporoflavus TaxID=28044 RepID=UPI00167CE16E|nr:NADP-dependent oxidoreductase [Streptomyces longisporoflavus]GGV22839.1 NADPH:quinone reductase [Streptomyces longisporoflavus]
MRAVIQKSFGGPEVLEVVEMERPTPSAGEVLVKVHASAVNPADVAVRSGAFPLIGEPPFGVGWDISGVVEEAGAGAVLAVGDEVYGMPLFPRAATGYAEYVTAPSGHFARKPASLDHVHAAAVPLAALTAWQGLVRDAEIKEGDRVLIQRAAGGVGHFAVQIAKARGAHVIAVASAGRRDFLRGLGADEIIDYRTTDFTEAVKDVDVLLDSKGQGDLSLGVVRPGGVLISILEHHDRELAARVEAAGRRFAGVMVEPDSAGLEALAELIDAGRVRPHVQETFPLAEAGRAHVLIAEGHVQGKIVLTV